MRACCETLKKAGTLDPTLAGTGNCSECLQLGHCLRVTWLYSPGSKQAQGTVPSRIKMGLPGTGKIVWWLRALAAPQEDMASLSISYMLVHNCVMSVTPVPEDLRPQGTSGLQVVQRHTGRQSTHIHKVNI